MSSSTSAPSVVPPPPPKPEQPLLPALLLGPTAFLWLWALPVGVMLFLNFQGFRLIEGNMDPSQRSSALGLGLAGALDFLLGITLCVAVRWRGKTRALAASPHPAWSLAAIGAQVAYLWLSLAWMDQILPRSVTVWMYPESHFLFNQFAFAMLPLFLGILRLSAAGTVRAVGKSIGINLALAIAGPVVLYTLFHLFRLLENWGRMAFVFLVIVAIVCGILMFVGLGRALLLLLRRTRDWGSIGERAAIVVFAFVLPIAGLVLNRSIPFPVDLQAWEVYALVLVNTGILLLASFQHARRPQLTFALLCATLPFSLYFFIVFLPYTPLSILAVIAMGAGFLVLTPILLFVMHLHLVKEAWSSPLLDESRGRALALGLICFLLLPAFFTVRGLADKTALNAALDYVYTPAIKLGRTTYPANRLNLARALRNHRSYKNGIFYPILSEYYSWLVFDDLVLPDEKLARLETVFFGKTGSVENTDPFRSKTAARSDRSVRDRSRMPRANPPPATVEVSQLSTRRASLDAQTSTITLALTLKNTGTSPAEYVKALPLPPGIFVSGFRLQVNGALVPGKIVEKKTALWVYAMIRDSERRDPGLIYYNTPTELELRVFPVAATAPSLVEIDFLAPSASAAIALAPDTSDPAAVLAKLGQNLAPQLARGDAGAYFSGGGAGASLPWVARDSYFHLIVDRSKENGYTGDLASALGRLKERFPNVAQARVTLANYNMVDAVDTLTSLEKLPSLTAAELDRALPLSGGFAADLALAHALRQHAERDLEAGDQNRLPPRPLFIILSRKAVPHSLELGLTEGWSDLVPELDIQEMGTDGSFVVHRSGNSAPVPLLRLGHSIRPLVPQHSVHFPRAAASDVICSWSQDGAWQPLSSIVERDGTDPWSRAARLHLEQQDYTRSPGDTRVGLKALVQASREAEILLPATSYIVVENSAQGRMLDLSERKKLGQNAALSFRETPAPPAFWVLAGFASWLAFQQLRRRRAIQPQPLS